MNSLRPSSQFGRRKKPRFLVMLVLMFGMAVVVIGSNALTGGGVSRILHTVARPLWGAEAGISSALSTLVEHVRAKQSLIDERDALQLRVAELEHLGVTNTALAQENALLLDTLGRFEEGGALPASILTRPGRTLYDTFVIDVGTEQGVVHDARVFGEGGVAVGTVAEVYSRTALVRLYSAPGRTTEVFIGESAAVEAVGRGGGDFEVRMPRGVPIAEGSPVVFSEIGGGILGVVEQVVADAADPFQTVLFGSPVNLQTIRIVTVRI